MRTVTIAVVVFLMTAVSLSAGPIDDAARRFLTLAYEGNSDRLPKAAHANTAAFELKVRNTLRVRCVNVANVEIRSVREDHQTAVVELAAVLHKSDRVSSWSTDELMALRIRLVYEGDAWLVSEIEYPDAELAAELLASKPDRQQEILRDCPDRITPGLAQAVYASAVQSMSTSPAARLRTYAQVWNIAQTAGDRGTETLTLAAEAFENLNTNSGEAARSSRESLRIAESTGDPDILARAWYWRARVIDSGKYLYTTLDRGTERSECDQKALSYAERAEDPKSLVRVLYGMANTAAADFDNLTARLYLDRLIPIARENNDAIGEMAAETVLAQIYFNQGDGERGLIHHLRALRLAEQNSPHAYTMLLLKTGQAFAAAGRIAEARQALAKALPRDGRGAIIVSPLAPRNYVAHALMTLADLEAGNGKPEEAACLAAEASGYEDRRSDNRSHIMARYELAAGHYSAALGMALRSLFDNPFPDERMDALKTAARAYRGLGQGDRASQLALEAIGIYESLDERVAGDEIERVRFNEGASGMYELAAELALERGDTLQALLFTERGRARVLNDILEHGRHRSLESDRAEQSRQEQLLARLNVDLDRVRTSGQSREAQAVAERLRQTRESYATFMDGTRAREARRRLSAPARFDQTALQSMLAHLPDGVAGLEYAVGDTTLRIFVIRKNAAGNAVVTSHSIPISRTGLNERVSRFAEIVAARNLNIHDAARELYSLLIEPVAANLSGARALIVVPDDALWRLPFAALVDPQGRFFVERFPLVYTPSLSAYVAMTTHDSGRHRARPVQLLAVGNPALDKPAAAQMSDFYRGATFGALPGAEHEVDALRSVYGASSIVLKGKEATEARTKREISRASVIHFATHALFDDANPAYSRLVLARDPSSAEDGMLESWEIAHLNLDADLVVLAACDTARGRVGGGEGVIGMAWSFFVAGARSTVATQWKVSSSNTARLMIAFHQALRTPAGNPAIRKAQALRDAQLQLLHAPESQHPFYWAAFVLVGDARR